jgi:hypothetical protein|tara:strand:+ start:131 stop:784 length:654 start_codon:yes stop_codon:yes gene_type:complete
MQDKDKDQIEVRTFNWGPCLINLQIRDDFKKVLLDEAKKNEIDYSDKLAGQIRKETGYDDKSRDKIVPYLAPYLGVYDQMFQKYQTKKYDKKPEYALTALWANFQRQYEFNPPHDHDGKLSFVIYLSIPDKLKEENKNYKGKSCGPGGIQFMWGEGPRDCVTYMSYFPKEGDMFIFPAWLKHWVSPFNSDCVRVSVSGNVHDSAPLNQVKKGALIKE